MRAWTAARWEGWMEAVMTGPARVVEARVRRAGSVQRILQRCGLDVLLGMVLWQCSVDS